MQKLDQKRKEWEKNLTCVLVVPVLVDGFPKVLAVLRYDDTHTSDFHFRLHRYFKVGGDWNVSVDVEREPELSTVLAALERDKDKSDLYKQITAL